LLLVAKTVHLPICEKRGSLSALILPLPYGTAFGTVSDSPQVVIIHTDSPSESADQASLAVTITAKVDDR